MKKTLAALFFTITISALAQDQVADSLKKVIESLPDDTVKVRALNSLNKHYAFTEPENTLNFSSITIRLAKRIGDKKGEAEALKWSGIAYGTKSNEREEMNKYLEALAIYDTLGDKQGIANIQSNIGFIYMNQGNDTKALEYLFSALKLGEETSDLLRVATVLDNIAVVYQQKRNTWEKAKKYYLESLRIARQIENKPIIGATTTSLAEYFMNLDTLKYDSALYYTQLRDSALYYAQISANVSKGTSDEMYPLNILGQINRKLKAYDRSIEYHTLAIRLSNKFESKYDLAFSYIGLGKTYQAKNELKLALENYKNGEKASVETNSNYYMREVYDSIASVYSKLHDYPNAFKYQHLLTGIKDTIYNADVDKKLQNFQFDFDMAKKEGEIKLQTQEIRRQTLVRNGFVGGFAVVLIFAGIFFNQRNRISKEKKRSDELLLNILPSETAEELKATGKAKTRSFAMVTVLFTDFKNFTQASEILTPEELVDEINHCYSEFDKIITRHGIEKIKTIGDAYMCAGGLPVSNETHPFDVVTAGLEMQKFIADNIIERKAQGKPFFELRLGIHTGPVVAGIVGIKKFAYDIWGDTVNTASRMESSGAIGKVNISGTTYELIKDRFVCTHRGKVEAKNKGQIDMYFVENSI